MCRYLPHSEASRFQLTMAKKCVIYYLTLRSTAAICNLKNVADYFDSTSISHIFLATIQNDDAAK